MAILALSNIINVTLSQTPTGVGIPNANNVLLLTTDTPTNLEVFGDYVSAAAVATNYGTNSVTAAMVNAMLSQTPNILSGDGQIIIAPFTPTNPAVSATSGHFVSESLTANLAGIIGVSNGDLKVTLNGGTAQNLANLNFTTCTTLQQVAAVLQAALIDCLVTATSSVLTITSNKVGTSSTVALAAYVGGGTDLTGGSYFATSSGTATAGANSSGETVAAAITRLLPQAFFAGVITNLSLEDAAISAAASAVQAQDMLFLHHVASSTDIAGIATTVQAASENKTRILPYLSAGQAGANLYKAAYAGRGFSMDFTGSNTSFTMHGKQLATITPDTAMTQTLLTACIAAGCDPYVSINGYAMIYSTGANTYFDLMYQFYLGFKFAMQTAGFNYLVQTNTKIPQTEPGMNGLKAAYIGINAQFVNNGCIAPNTWGSSETFGDPVIFNNNIEANGYYVYSSPVALQTSAARNARQAPLVQNAVKTAGAIQTSNVTVVVTQ